MGKSGWFPVHLPFNQFCLCESLLVMDGSLWGKSLEQISPEGCPIGKKIAEVFYWNKQNKYLVGDFNPSEKEYESANKTIPKIWKNGIHVPNYQPDIFIDPQYLPTETSHAHLGEALSGAALLLPQLLKCLDQWKSCCFKPWISTGNFKHFHLKSPLSPSLMCLKGNRGECLRPIGKCLNCDHPSWAMPFSA